MASRPPERAWLSIGEEVWVFLLKSVAHFRVCFSSSDENDPWLECEKYMKWGGGNVRIIT